MPPKVKGGGHILGVCVCGGGGGGGGLSGLISSSNGINSSEIFTYLSLYLVLKSSQGHQNLISS